MERIKCEIREAGSDDRGMLMLLAEETLHPLAEGAGHPERYHAADVVELLDRADVFVAQCGGEPGGFVAVETEGDACAVRCICVNPGFEARGVANQLLDWVEGLAIERRLARLVALRARRRTRRRCTCTAATASSARRGTTRLLDLEKRLPAAD